MTVQPLRAGDVVVTRDHRGCRIDTVTVEVRGVVRKHWFVYSPTGDLRVVTDSFGAALTLVEMLHDGDEVEAGERTAGVTDFCQSR